MTDIADETETSPLCEADPQSLEFLFAQDPLQLAERDIDRIVQELRSQRQRWQVEGIGTDGKRKPQPGTRSAKKTTDVSLADLGL